MRSLQPGEPEGVLFRYLFISLLPDVVREVVANMESLDDMAKAAKSILESNAAARISAAQVVDAQVAAVRRPQSSRRGAGDAAPAVSTDADNAGLCRTHVRYGHDAFKCDRPTSCPMRSVIKPRSGNGPAGRR